MKRDGPHQNIDKHVQPIYKYSGDDFDLQPFLFSFSQYFFAFPASLITSNKYTEYKIYIV